MSRLLDQAATLDADRAAALAANDDAAQPFPVRAFRVDVKRGQAVRLSLGAMARSSVDATLQHMDLLNEGEYLFVSPIGSAA